MIDTISLDKIYVRLFDDNGVVNPYKMENTPHYKLLTENSNEYAEFLIISFVSIACALAISKVTGLNINATAGATFTLPK